MPAPVERAFVATPFAGPGARVIASPFQFLADADTFLRVTSVCSVANVVLAVQGRRYDEQQVLRPIVETHTPLSTRTKLTQDYKIGDGAILNLTVFASSGSPLKGQCYVLVQLLRNVGSTAIVLGTLLGGYVTATQALGFPGSPIVSSTDGEPAIRALTGTLPAAGVNILEAVPTGARWELIAAKFQFVTGGAAGVRRVTFNADNGVVNLFQVEAFNTSNPLETWNHCFAPNLEGTSDAGVGLVQSGTPGRMLATGGWRFYTVTSNLAAADQFSAPTLTVREWLEVN